MPRNLAVKYNVQWIIVIYFIDSKGYKLKQMKIT